jgi:ATP-dependent DNA ligase
MLLRSARLSRSGDYSFEVKFDGFRCLVSKHGRLRAISRRRWDMTGLLPELQGLPDGLALDGELVAIERPASGQVEIVSAAMRPAPIGSPVLTARRIVAVPVHRPRPTSMPTSTASSQ